MDDIQLKERGEGTGCPDVEELKPPPLSPGRSDGSVSMETREEEERRWRRHYPEIKKCAILIKKLFKEEKDEVGSRSADPEAYYDWMEPLKPKVIRRRRVGRFVKRMEVSADVCNGKPRGRGRGRGLLRLTCCTGEDGVHIGPRKWAKGQVTTKNHKNSINQSETEHWYSSQSQDGRASATCGQKDRKSTKKKPPKIVFRKVAGKKWVLSRSKVKKQQPEEVVGGSGITTKNTKEIAPSHDAPGPKKRKKRQNSCGRCAACLRENCGKCPFCLDKKKFGGAERQKQRCINRRCLVRLRNKKLPRWVETEKGVEEETVTMTTKRQQQPNSRKLKRQKTEEEEEEVEKRGTKQGRMKQREKRRQRESKKKWTPPATEVMFEENEDLHPDGALTGTHTQEGSVLHVSTGLTYIPPPPPAPPPLHPLSPLPKEEEEEVDIDFCRMMEDGTGWEQKEEELVYPQVMWEQEKFYDIEVQLQESDEETLTCPSDGGDNDGQVMTSDPENELPESISLWSSSLSPLGDESSDDVTCGRGWLQLLKALWMTVLPAHWVVVVAEGPELQLLQCSRLSSMTNTIVHIQPNLGFFITVEARRLPDTHMLYQTHKWTITHVHQLVSLLLHLEGLVVCPGSSPTCHLLLTPPCLTCVPCLFRDAHDAATEEGRTDDRREDNASSPLTFDLTQV